MSLPNKDYTAISIKDSSISYPPSSKLFCNLCSCNLILADPQMEEWFCTRCNVSYYPNKGERIKRANKFETPGPAIDKHGNITGDKRPIVSMIDNTPNLSPKKSVFPRSFETLKRPGVNITGFSSTVDNEGL
ncbi:MAG TPA: hypothetical protein VLR10_02485 [Nitrososphaeraceae archaeon]|nr:hypothetical protein [Nitrososphaeraceae archaeon]